MSDEIIALEHKADGVVPVGVPVSVLIFLRGHAINNQVAAVIPVQSPYDVEKRGLSGAAGPQDGHKFVVPQVQAYMVQRLLHQASCPVFLTDVFNLKHV